MRLFVYGTLMKGQSSHHLLAGARPLGPVATQPRYALLDLGAYPALVPGEGVVRGELYQIAPEALADLDAYEGEAYRRVAVALEDGEAQGYLFAAPAPDAPVIASGDWRNR